MISQNSSNVGGFVADTSSATLGNKFSMNGCVLHNGQHHTTHTDEWEIKELLGTLRDPTTEQTLLELRGDNASLLLARLIDVSDSLFNIQTF